MTAANTLRAELQANIAECATNIVADLKRQGISTEVAIAIAATVVGMLTDDLPAEQRATFLTAYARDILRVPRYDA